MMVEELLERLALQLSTRLGLPMRIARLVNVILRGGFFQLGILKVYAVIVGAPDGLRMRVHQRQRVVLAKSRNVVELDGVIEKQRSVFFVFCVQ